MRMLCPLRCFAGLLVVAAAVGCPRLSAGQQAHPLVPQMKGPELRTRPETAPVDAAPVLLDAVVAVVNRRPILDSEIEDEIRLSVLDPMPQGGEALSRPRALEQLISRALIEQQIRREQDVDIDPTQAQIDARLREIRSELPFCVHRNCASEAGWRQVLAARGLTPERVNTYLRYRLQILSFIELRFRPGIRVAPEEISDYYTHTLLPQYRSGEQIPPLAAVSDRIGEILLEQRVNALFSDWLENLRKQGDVEILAPALEATGPAATGPDATTPAATTPDATGPDAVGPGVAAPVSAVRVSAAPGPAPSGDQKGGGR